MSLAVIRRHALAFALAAAVGGFIVAWTSTRPAPVRLPDLGAVEDSWDEIHLPFGPVRPSQGLPATRLVLDDGTETDLPSILAGRWTMMQLMFTSCSTTCPIQGAIFERAQQIARERQLPLHFLSLSIDPLVDTPASLSAWLRTFGAGPDWRAAIPRAAELPDLVGLLHGRGEGVDVHDARVYLVDPSGRLVYATEDLPDPAALARLADEALAAPEAGQPGQSSRP